MITIQFEQLGELLGKTPEEIAEAYKDSEEGQHFDILKSLHSDNLKSIVSRRVDEQYGRATKEVLTKKEKELSEKYGIDTQKIDDMIEEIISKKVSEVEGSTEVTPEMIKSHPLYQDELKNFRDKLDLAEKEKSDIQTKFERKTLEKEISSLLPSMVSDDSFVIPKDDEVKSNLMSLLTNELLSGSKATDSGLIPVDENGERLRSDDYRDVEWKSWASSKVSKFFPKKASDNRQGTGTRTSNQTGGTDNTFNFEKKDPAKFRELLKEHKGDKAKQEAIYEAYRNAPN